MNESSVAHQMVEKYQRELGQLLRTKEGINRSIIIANAKLEASRELAGLPPLHKKRGRPRKNP